MVHRCTILWTRALTKLVTRGETCHELYEFNQAVKSCSAAREAGPILQLSFCPIANSTVLPQKIMPARLRPSRNTSRAPAAANARFAHCIMEPLEPRPFEVLQRKSSPRKSLASVGLHNEH
jgi:hypothetical protein